MSTTYKIAEVADRSGFPSSTLRYWEEIGILPRAARTDGGYRTYDDSDLERLAFVARAKQLGCTLDEIGDLVTTWDDRECGPVQHRLRHVVDTKLDDAQERIAELTAFTAQLRRAAAQLSARPSDGPCDDGCGCTGPAAAASSGVTQPVRLSAEAPDPDPAVIACTLNGADMGARLDHWNDLLASVTRRDAVPDGIRLTFGADTDAVEVARLATAEQDCCSFFRFALTVDARGVALEVRAPADAGDLLAALFGEAS